VRVLKHYPFQETEATMWGKRVHKAAELRVRDNTPFDFDFPGQDVVEALAVLPGDKYCELEMAVNDKLEMVAFDDPSAVLRGIADLIIVNGETARVCDYKTGSDKYPDVEQLELMALMMFIKFPQVTRSHGALLFLATDKVVQKITKREDAQALWVNWMAKVGRVESAHELGVWNPKTSGLCRKWCPVTTCEHNGLRD